VETTREGNKSKYVVQGERKSVQVNSPRGDRVASIDLGINVLASTVLNDGIWLLYKGVRTKEDYLGKRVSEVQSLADRIKGEHGAYEELSRERRILFKRLTSRLLHLYSNFAPHPALTDSASPRSTWATRSTSLKTRATSPP
jgi:putative transposase